MVLVAIALIAGLALITYKYRRFPKSLLASAARGKHSRLTNDYADDDGNVGLTIHEGIFYVRLIKFT